MPNDPRYDELWGVKKIGSAAAWDTAAGENAVVAVIDTGVDYTHPDLAANIWTNPGEIPGNGIDDDGNGYVDDVHGYDFVDQRRRPVDDNGHGTHVAGTIAAEGNNGVGVVGVAWKARIMACAASTTTAAGPVDPGQPPIAYAADNGADVINASWGGVAASPAANDAIAYAHGLGMVFVAAAGNSNMDARRLHPGRLPRRHRRRRPR